MLFTAQGKRRFKIAQNFRTKPWNPGKALVEFDDLDDLSNSVLDLIDAKKFDEAESVCNELKKRYPDQVDGIERLAMVYEACGEKQKASEYYLKSAEFMRSNPGYDKETIQGALNVDC